jgi:hypothetical protein
MLIKIIEKSYHRNGVSGEPFYLIDFTLWEEEDEEGIDLLAVMTEKQCYIIDPENINNKFRGDRIGDELRERGEWLGWDFDF